MLDSLRAGDRRTRSARRRGRRRLAGSPSPPRPAAAPTCSSPAAPTSRCGAASAPTPATTGRARRRRRHGAGPPVARRRRAPGRRPGVVRRRRRRLLRRPDIRSSDWQDDPAFTPWVSRLAGAVDRRRCPPARRWRRWRSRPAPSTRRDHGRRAGRLGGDRFAANYPEPSMWVEAVLAVPDGTAVPDGVAGDRRRPLAGPAGTAPATAAQPLPGATTMLALRTLWQESDVKRIRVALAAASPSRPRLHGRAAGRRRRRATTPTTRRDRRADATRPTPATASSSTWPSAARRSPCSRTSPTSSTRPPPPRSTAAASFVRPRSVASGLAATLIPEGWPNPEANGEPPVIWSPAASAWAGIVNDRAGAGAGAAGHAVHAHAARDRHAPPDGRGAGLARAAARLRRPR